MIATRALPGHWSTTETSSTWLADLVLDLSTFPPGWLEVTFAADVIVPSDEQGYFALNTGGTPQTIGDTSAASVNQNGPYTGTITGTCNSGIIATTDPAILHLVALCNNGQPVEISSVVVAIRDTR